MHNACRVRFIAFLLAVVFFAPCTAAQTEVDITRQPGFVHNARLRRVGNLMAKGGGLIAGLSIPTWMGVTLGSRYFANRRGQLLEQLQRATEEKEIDFLKANLLRIDRTLETFAKIIVWARRIGLVSGGIAGLGLLAHPAFPAPTPSTRPSSSVPPLDKGSIDAWDIIEKRAVDDDHREFIQILRANGIAPDEYERHVARNYSQGDVEWRQRSPLAVYADRWSGDQDYQFQDPSNPVPVPHTPESWAQLMDKKRREALGNIRQQVGSLVREKHKKLLLDPQSPVTKEAIKERDELLLTDFVDHIKDLHEYTEQRYVLGSWPTRYEDVSRGCAAFPVTASSGDWQYHIEFKDGLSKAQIRDILRDALADQSLTASYNDFSRGVLDKVFKDRDVYHIHEWLKERYAQKYPGKYQPLWLCDYESQYYPISASALGGP